MSSTMQAETSFMFWRDISNGNIGPSSSASLTSSLQSSQDTLGSTVQLEKMMQLQPKTQLSQMKPNKTRKIVEIEPPISKTILKSDDNMEQSAIGYAKQDWDDHFITLNMANITLNHSSNSSINTIHHSYYSLLLYHNITLHPHGSHLLL